jgi:preprotein translocase subunit SecB
MKPKLSQLCLLDFAVINSSFKFAVDNGVKASTPDFNSYPIDIDYAIASDDNNRKRVFVKISINEEDKQSPRYVIVAECVGIFDLSDFEGLSEKDKQSLIHYSAVSIVLNSLRGYIASMTAHSPLGKYMLPSIDMNDLIKQKMETLKKKGENEARKNKKENKSTK